MPDRGAGADGQPAVRIGHPGGDQRRAADSARRGATSCSTGGMESMSQAPHVIRGLRSGLRLGQGQLEDTLWSALLDTHCGCTMAATAENCAAKYGVVARGAGSSTRCAASSSRHAPGPRAASPTKSCRSSIKTRKGTERRSRRTITCGPTRRSKALAKLPAAFSKNGCVTAGNAAGIVDGGAALLLASEPAVRDARPDAARTARRLGDRRRRADADGHGAGAGDAPGAREGRTDARRHRSHRDQRSVRRAVPGGREGARASIATRSTSTAARSRSAIRSA